jgi:hypothetical protein
MATKIHRAWVTENVRADGRKFYTAYLRLKTVILWFIPVYVTSPLVETIHSTKVKPDYWVSQNEWDGNAYKFKSKSEAEYELLCVIDKMLDQMQAKKDKIVVAKKSSDVSFGSFDH